MSDRGVPLRQEELPNNLNNRTTTYRDGLSVKEPLLRMIGRITPNLALRQDLLQEALIHLWLTEARRPGQTKSWYLQSSKFHLLHFLASGRSVDCPKRARYHSHFEEDSEHIEDSPELADPGDSVVSQVIARDIISVLSSHLSSHENAVLKCLANGQGLREIGRRLEMSHTMVIKHRSNIAALLVKLERPSFPKRQLPRANGTNKDANGGKVGFAGETNNAGFKPSNGSSHTPFT